MDTNCTICIRATRYGLFLTSLLLFALPTARAQTSADTLWFEDWPEGIGDWFADGGTWEVGEPTSGPGECYSPPSCAATILDGNYSEGVDSRLIRFTSFLVPPASENPRLRFWHWFSFSSIDGGEVQVRVDGGEWETVSETYVNTSPVWTSPLIDLSPYADMVVQVGFRFHSADAGFPPGPDVSSGWYIDDVSLVSGPLGFSSLTDWEAGIGEWSAERGTWEVGEPTSGPEECYSPLSCAATALDRNYTEGVDSRLTSPRFLVPPASENPRLRFWHWFSFSSIDGGEVQVRVDGGEWETVSETYVNTSPVWTSPLIDLSPYADMVVQVGFRFHSADAGFPPGPDVSSGWYIDDVSVEGFTTATEPLESAGSFALRGAYPNPSISAATIAVAFGLPEPAEVTLRVFDVLGREVATATERLPAGEHRLPWEAGGLASGVYLYRVEARMPGGTEVRSGRLTLVE